MHTTIKPHQLGYLTIKLAKLNRRAPKLGFAPLTLDVVERTERKQVAVDVYVDTKVLDVTLNGIMPAIPGYRVIARIEHTSAGNIVNVAPGEIVDDVYMASLRRQDGTCAHCNTRRARIETFVVESAAEGTRIVGRNCLADFCRGADLATMLAFWAAWSLATKGSHDGPGRGRLDVLEALRGASCASRNAGLTKGADIAPWIYHNAGAIRLDHSGRPCCEQHFTPDATDLERAEQCLAWIASDASGASNYMHNLRIACAEGYTRTKNANLVYSGMASFDRAMGVLAAKRTKAATAVPSTSKHVGVIGTRQEFGAVTVVRRRCIDTDYGTTTIIGLRTDAGDELVWFASGVHDVEPGERYNALKATPKKHNDWKGTAQTVISRAVLGEKIADAERMRA